MCDFYFYLPSLLTFIGLKRSAQPTIHELVRIDHRGKTVRVIQSCATHWKDIAMLLYVGLTMELIDLEHHQKYTKACTAMFNLWLQGGEGLRKPRT